MKLIRSCDRLKWLKPENRRLNIPDLNNRHPSRLRYYLQFMDTAKSSGNPLKLRKNPSNFNREEDFKLLKTLKPLITTKEDRPTETGKNWPNDPQLSENAPRPMVHKLIKTSAKIRALRIQSVQSVVESTLLWSPTMKSQITEVKLREFHPSSWRIIRWKPNSKHIGSSSR